MHRQKRIRTSVSISLAIVLILSAGLFIALNCTGHNTVTSTLFHALSPYLFLTFLFLSCLLWSILTILSSDKTVKASLCAMILGAISLTGIFLFDYNLFLDIPQLIHPATTYLRHFSFVEVPPLNNEEDTTTWHLEGYSYDAGYITIPIDQKLYAENIHHHTPSDDHYAKVTYLSHTKILYDITILESADEIPLQSPDINELSFMYEDALYTLPMQVQDALDKGWIIDEYTEPEMILTEGNTSSTLWLKHENGDTLTITIHNTKEKTIPIEEGTIHYLTFFPSSSCLLPHNLIINWSTRNEVINTYGTPHEKDEKTIMYAIDDNTSIRLYFDENQYLDGVQYQT